MRTLLALGVLLAACHPPGSLGTDPGSPQAPPTTSADDVHAWLKEGHYLTWHCEAEPHAPRAGSGHEKNRICSNDLLSAAGPGEFPVDSASVKELYDGGDIKGWAVSRHVSAGTTPDTWFWYELDGGSLNAVGLGDMGNPLKVCSGCHLNAGQGGRTGHDFVFTQVQ